MFIGCLEMIRIIKAHEKNGLGFTTLIVVMASQVYTQVKMCHIAYFKNVVYANITCIKLFLLIWTLAIQTLALG